MRILTAIGISLALHAAACLFPYLGVHLDKRYSSEIRATIMPQAAAQRVSQPPSILATLEPIEKAIELAPRIPPPRPVTPDPKPLTQGVDFLPFAGPEYFQTTELTVKPEPAVPILLDSPKLGELRGSGRVIINVWIDKFGDVSDTQILFSDVPQAFADFAVNAFRHARFVPGERNGKRVGVIMKMEIRYDDFTPPVKGATSGQAKGQ
ncbi:MAG: TonB family protein [Betaproteobacteria bacterium]